MDVITRGEETSENPHLSNSPDTTTNLDCIPNIKGPEGQKHHPRREV